MTGTLVPRKFTYEAELESAIEELPHQNASVEMRFWHSTVAFKSTKFRNDLKE